MNGPVIPASGVVPGLRDPVGSSGAPFPWGDFRPQDLETCYPRSTWLRQRLAAPRPPSRGNAITDPFPVPFTTEEVKDALRDVYRHRKDQTDRHCAPVDNDSVQIALAVLPILESRNGGWLDFDPDRRESSFRNAPSTPRRDVFNLRCLLSKLPGKPLPPIYAGPCRAQQPRRLAALLNIEDVATTYQPAAAAPRAGGLFSFGAPQSDAPGGGNAYFPDLSPVGGRPFFPADGDRLGFQLNGDVPAPEAPSHTLFEILETYDIKGD